jgi:hypothetical protein
MGVALDSVYHLKIVFKHALESGSVPVIRCKGATVPTQLDPVERELVSVSGHA